mmetsp:Transcript_21878/g.62746  ORF Transcript_21878/g.62746 Transcript_21878/m.62746 type:complete len:159 (+) Transcript_21878:1464-1940(+)
MKSTSIETTAPLEHDITSNGDGTLSSVSGEAEPVVQPPAKEGRNKEEAAASRPPSIVVSTRGKVGQSSDSSKVAVRKSNPRNYKAPAPSDSSLRSAPKPRATTLTDTSNKLTKPRSSGAKKVISIVQDIEVGSSARQHKQLIRPRDNKSAASINIILS